MRIHLLYRVLNFLPILPYTSALYKKATWKFVIIYCSIVHGTLYLGLHHSILHVEQNSYERVSRGNPIKVYTTDRKKKKERKKERKKGCRQTQRGPEGSFLVPDSEEVL